MKRLSIAIILLVLALSAYVNSIDRRVQALLDDLAKKYILTRDTLVFTYVDRELLEEALEEIELSLSDLTEGSTVEVGRIEEVELLLSGSVLEEGEDFLVTLQLVSKSRFAKEELIEEGNRVAYAYVMANGIGSGVVFSPGYWFVYPQEGCRGGRGGEKDCH